MRESALGERERLLDARAAELAVSPDPAERAQRAEARAGRESARHSRDDAHTDRDRAADARGEAAERRLEAAPTTRLASTFAAIAETLYSADSYDAVLLRIAQAAVDTVAGCEMASVTLCEGGTYRTAATTAAEASAVDRAQYDAGEGPSLDAVETPVVYARTFRDARWPALGSRRSWERGRPPAAVSRPRALSRPQTLQHGQAPPDPSTTTAASRTRSARRHRRSASSSRHTPPWQPRWSTNVAI
ncbi:hypothetical protein GCM10028802_28850 [Terrabacter terrigena]